MVNRTGGLSRFVIFAAIAMLFPAALLAQAATAPQIVTINGDPLKINVAADGSFQVFNAAVPGSGQIFPTGCNFGDMGVFEGRRAMLIDGVILEQGPMNPPHAITPTLRK